MISKQQLHVDRLLSLSSPQTFRHLMTPKPKSEDWDYVSFLVSGSEDQLMEEDVFSRLNDSCPTPSLQSADNSCNLQPMRAQRRCGHRGWCEEAHGTLPTLIGRES